MSRSYRHNNIISISVSGYKGSEKKDKQRANRKHRSKCNQILNGVDIERAEDGIQLPVMNEIEEVYTWQKDGKQYVDNWKNCPDPSMYFTKDGKLKR